MWKLHYFYTQKHSKYICIGPIFFLFARGCRHPRGTFYNIMCPPIYYYVQILWAAGTLGAPSGHLIWYYVPADILLCTYIIGGRYPQSTFRASYIIICVRRYTNTIYIIYLIPNYNYPARLKLIRRHLNSRN